MGAQICESCKLFGPLLLAQSFAQTGVDAARARG
jgi:hypothetical protein